MARPALVVLVAVDQFPIRLLDATRPWLAPDGGITRLLGGYQATATHAHGGTTTCPGHATLSTGASPSVHGVVANRWYVDGKQVYCADPDGDGAPDIGALRADTVGDRLIAAGGRVVSLGLKDRAPIMLGGRSPTALAWFDRKQAAFVPRGSACAAGCAWMDAVKPQLGQPWVPLRAEYGVPDDQPFESIELGRTFPHVPPVDGDAWLYTPGAGATLTDLAIAGVDALDLGARSTPDLLAVAYSQVDYIGHAWTADSWEARDAILALDRDLGRLFAHLDAKLPGRWAVVLSSDHGSTPGSARRLPPAPVESAVRTAATVAGAPDADGTFDEPMFWLPAGTDPAKRDAAARAAAAAFRAAPGVANAWAMHADPGTADPAVLLSYDAERAGDVYVLLEPDTLWLHGDGTGTDHGTPYPADQDVPLLAWGAGVVTGVTGAPTDTRVVAPTVAALLGVGAPAQAEKPAETALLTPSSASPARP